MNTTIFNKDEETLETYISNYDVKLERRFEYPLGRVELPLKKSFKIQSKHLIDNYVASSANTSNGLFEANQNILFTLRDNPNENKYDFLEILKGKIDTKIESMRIDSRGKNTVLVSVFLN